MASVLVADKFIPSPNNIAEIRKKMLDKVRVHTKELGEEVRTEYVDSIISAMKEKALFPEQKQGYGGRS